MIISTRISQSNFEDKDGLGNILFLNQSYIKISFNIYIETLADFKDILINLIDSTANIETKR